MAELYGVPVVDGVVVFDPPVIFEGADRSLAVSLLSEDTAIVQIDGRTNDTPAKRPDPLS